MRVFFRKSFEDRLSTRFIMGEGVCWGGRSGATKYWTKFLYLIGWLTKSLLYRVMRTFPILPSKPFLRGRYLVYGHFLTRGFKELASLSVVDLCLIFNSAQLLVKRVGRDSKASRHLSRIRPSIGISLSTAVPIDQGNHIEHVMSISGQTLREVSRKRR